MQGPQGVARGSEARGGLLRYGLVETVLGPALVAATARGVCRVSFATTAGELEDDLKVAYPAVVLRRDDARLAEALRAVATQSAGHAPCGAGGVTPPSVCRPVLDVHGTLFQCAVWAALQAIPPGETRSYAQLAAAIGRPGAVRAVGHACGANPVAVLIPCHRATRADGRPGGYRWGPARKLALLAAEREAVHGRRPAPPIGASAPLEGSSDSAQLRGAGVALGL